MPEDFVHLRVVFVVLASLTTVLLAYFLQRVYYRFRTRGEESVETMHLRLLDWLAFFGVFFFLWLASGAFMAWRNHADWLNAKAGVVAHTIEVGNIDPLSGTTTLLVYRGGERLSELREGIVIAEDRNFTLDVSIVRYSRLLKGFGQNDVIQIGEFNANEDQESKGEGIWPWIARIQHARISAPRELKSGDVLEIFINDRGDVEARRRVENPNS